MALQRYVASVVTSGGSAELFTVPSGSEAAIVATKILGGSSGGEVSIQLVRNNAVVASETYSIAADDVVVLDTKDFYVATDKVQIVADSTTITVEMSGDVSVVS